MTVKRSKSNTGPTKPMATAEQEIFDIASKSETPKLQNPQVSVFAVFGVEPEIQAYAMAKYSRSALSMKESLREISTHKAEKRSEEHTSELQSRRDLVCRLLLEKKKKKKSSTIKIKKLHKEIYHT